MEESNLRSHIRYTVNVKARSQENKLIVEPDGTITVRVVAPPVKDEANRMVVRILAKALKKSKSEVRIVAGMRSNVKIVEIKNISKAEFLKKVTGSGH